MLPIFRAAMGIDCNDPDIDELVYWDENGGVIKRERFWPEDALPSIEQGRDVPVLTLTAHSSMAHPVLEHAMN